MPDEDVNCPAWIYYVKCGAVNARHVLEDTHEPDPSVPAVERLVARCMRLPHSARENHVTQIEGELRAFSTTQWEQAKALPWPSPREQR